jgi:hypothetical protein
MKTTTNLITKQIVSLVALRLADKTSDAQDAKYAKLVAELAKKTKKTPQHIRTYARRAARRSKMN